jgi:hypothetical protein
MIVEEEEGSLITSNNTVGIVAVVVVFVLGLHGLDSLDLTDLKIQPLGAEDYQRALDSLDFMEKVQP